ncbi:CBR-SEC-10 protein, partial [Aphelenchoides avenae]
VRALPRPEETARDRRDSVRVQGLLAVPRRVRRAHAEQRLPERERLRRHPGAMRTGKPHAPRDLPEPTAGHAEAAPQRVPREAAGRTVLILPGNTRAFKETVLAKLEETEEDPEAYLSSLHELYSKTLKLQHSLEKFRSDTDQQFLTTLIRSIFGAYLSTYPKTEQKFIDNQCNAVLARFYDSKGHQKKNFLGGGLGELKRDIQARLLSVETYGGETFLSEEVAINVLQETKNAFARCNILCKPPESIQMTESLFDLLLRYLFKEHVDYAIELALAGIPLAEPKTEPPTHFFAVVQQTNAITHLFVKQFDDSIYPLVKDTNAEEMVIKRRDATLAHIESQLNKGLERQINAIVGYMRFLLNTEQKKADFRPEDESRDITTMSNACASVTKYVKRAVDRVRDSVDGKNLSAVLEELGTRMYTVVLGHIRSFSYNTAGAMLLLCDINAY